MPFRLMYFMREEVNNPELLFNTQSDYILTKSNYIQHVFALASVLLSVYTVLSVLCSPEGQSSIRKIYLKMKKSNHVITNLSQKRAFQNIPFS